MIEPVNNWLWVQPISDDEDDFDLTDTGVVEVRRDKDCAPDTVGIKFVTGMKLLVEPSLIMKVGNYHFIEATTRSIYAIITED